MDVQYSVESPMETVSCPILYTLRSPSIINHTNKYYQDSRNHLHFLPLFSPTFPRNISFRGKNVQFNRFTASSSLSTSRFHQDPSQELAILLEVEGVLMDVYRLGNRQGFNVAFQKLGLDCANWTEPVYLDLVRKSAGDEERMLILYFNRIGWPTSLPTSEKGTFIKNVLLEKKNALDDFVMSKNLPLRPGVEDFIDDAYKEGIPVVILTAYSKSGDKIARSIIEKLGNDRTSKIKIVGNEEVEQSFYGQLALGKGVSSGLDEQLAKEARKAASAEKQRIAEEVASLLKLSVEINSSSTESLQKIVAALRAGAEYAEVPVYHCVLIAGSQSGIAGAKRIGMPCVVLRSRSGAKLLKSTIFGSKWELLFRLWRGPNVVQKLRLVKEDLVWLCRILEEASTKNRRRKFVSVFHGRERSLRVWRRLNDAGEYVKVEEGIGDRCHVTPQIPPSTETWNMTGQKTTKMESNGLYN
ncbi:hypothetical protein F0562_029583 [Nyssa sinensis]|uniref:Haloacid dehalogenase-like hydrolase domain-containing protein n=1 Tax=Nyssa sinensis TaxID=561372 RepID=A0A5J5B1E8_9ASTE|nr:hypothetical protein F0562_029583 [Nyssa sinensis]